MARGKGTANLAASLEVLAGAPLDARDICPTVADLYVAANWTYKYIGMKTTVQATGDTYRLVNLDVTQESSWVKEGSSGGGHTIEGDGTAVTDRDTLNFKDMSVSDDSQNEKTDVKPHRLTQAELADIISPLPFFDFSNPGAEAFIFSTNERVIGQWIDSKPLYQKTIISTISTGEVSVNHDIANVDTIFVSEAFVVKPSTGNTIRLGGNGASSKQQVQAGTSKIWIYNNESGYTKVVVNLRYTKTTDQPVATGEKIVGQTSYGNIIYERTYDYPNISIGSTWTDEALNITWGSIWIESGYFVSGTDNYPFPYPQEASSYMSAVFDASQWTISLKSAKSRTGHLHVVVRYTKT